MPNNSKGKLTYSLEGSHVSHLARQESEKARMITDISGLTCLESYRKSSQHGSSLKMFTELLVGMRGWSSNRCMLTWKLQDTKYKRLYFQLAVSVLRTEGIEYGLLPTPTARDWKGARTPEKLQEVGRGKSNSLPDYVAVAIGETGQLNPRFVGEMMGFPVNWAEFPFRSGDGKQ